MDLERCVTALEQRQNRIYEWNFVRNLKARMRRKARLFPGRFPLDGLRRIRTVRQFDDAFTAPHHGFRDAHDYYYRASALRVVDKIRVPTLIVSAQDDPFVPPEPFRDRAVTGNPAITVLLTPEGGHCGFVSDTRTYEEMAIGLNGRLSSSSRCIADRYSKLLHQRARELRPLAGLFVFEIDEGIALGPLANDLRPSVDVAGCVPFIAKAESHSRLSGRLASTADRYLPRRVPGSAL